MIIYSLDMRRNRTCVGRLGNYQNQITTNLSQYISPENRGYFRQETIQIAEVSENISNTDSAVQDGGVQEEAAPQGGPCMCNSPISCTCKTYACPYENARKKRSVAPQCVNLQLQLRLIPKPSPKQIEDHSRCCNCCKEKGRWCRGCRAKRKRPEDGNFDFQRIEELLGQMVTSLKDINEGVHDMRDNQAAFFCACKPSEVALPEPEDNCSDRSSLETFTCAVEPPLMESSLPTRPSWSRKFFAYVSHTNFRRKESLPQTNVRDTSAKLVLRSDIGENVETQTLSSDICQPPVVLPTNQFNPAVVNHQSQPHSNCIPAETVTLKPEHAVEATHLQNSEHPLSNNFDTNKSSPSPVASIQKMSIKYSKDEEKLMAPSVVERRRKHIYLPIKQLSRKTKKHQKEILTKLLNYNNIAISSLCLNRGPKVNANWKEQNNGGINFTDITSQSSWESFSDSD